MFSEFLSQAGAIIERRKDHPASQLLQTESPDSARSVLLWLGSDFGPGLFFKWVLKCGSSLSAPRLRIV